MGQEQVLCIHVMALFGIFVGLLTAGEGVSPTLLLALWILFLLLVCFVQPLYEGLCLVLLCLVVLSCLVGSCLLEASSSLKMGDGWA